MAITEHSRHQLHTRLDRCSGAWLADGAPATGWLGRRRAEARPSRRVGVLLKAELRAEWRLEMRTLLLAIPVATNATLAALAFGAAQLV